MKNKQTNKSNEENKTKKLKKVTDFGASDNVTSFHEQ